MSLAAVFFTWCIATVYALARGGRLSFRYALGWLTLFLVGLFGSFSIGLLEPIAEWLNVTPAAVLAVGGVTILVAICIQLSISISGLQQQVRRLATELALLRSIISELSEPADD